MAEETAIQKKREAIKKDLFSGDEKVVLAAVKKCEKNGDESLVQPLLIAFRDAQEGAVRAEIKKLLETLKVSKGEDVLIEALENEEFAPIAGEIMSFLWNSGFQPDHKIELIVNKGLEGDFMCAVEGLTLLESLNGPVDEASLAQGLIDVREFLLEHKDTENQNFQIALNMYEVLSGFEE